MPSAAKLAANRRNALRSTGPRTIAGSRASSTNATRHGLSATSVVVIQGVEDEAEYEALVPEVIADLKPMGAVERLLAERVAQLLGDNYRDRSASTILAAAERVVVQVGAFESGGNALLPFVVLSLKK